MCSFKLCVVLTPHPPIKNYYNWSDYSTAFFFVLLLRFWGGGGGGGICVF